jgi:hypothetical protein
MPDPFSFDSFLLAKDSLAWQQVMVKRPGVGVMRLFTWAGYAVRGGTVSGIPSYYASVSIDEEKDTVSIILTVNSRFDKAYDPYRPRPGHKVIDSVVVGRQDEVNDSLIADAMRQRYGMEALDFRRTPMTPQVGRGGWKANEQVSENILARKTLYSPKDGMIAVVILRKARFTRSPDRYQVCALAVPVATGLAGHENRLRRKQSLLDVKEAMADWNRTIRELRGIGFTEEQVVPEWANQQNWDFDLGMPLEDSRRLNRALNETAEEYSSNIDVSPDVFGGGDDFSSIFEPIGATTRTAQAIPGFSGQIPDPAQLDQYVGTPGVDASQIRGIFSGVDEAISLINQFDGRLLNNVAFIYNYTGGDAYGIYMSALDEKIKDSKLRSLLRMDGYQIQDVPGGGFYVTHKDKTKEQIDSEVKAYRQKIDQRGATTFGIDMNKVISAARADASESNPPITDPQDQHALGVMHLGATMVHEAVHAAGEQTEGPSEGTEARFMQWVMPVVNQRRQQRYQSEGREQEYSPLIIDPNRRRSAAAFNWLERAAADGLAPKLIAEMTPDEFAVEGMTASKHKLAIFDAVDAGRPVSAVACEAYGFDFSGEGYARDGDLLVRAAMPKQAQFGAQFPVSQSLLKGLHPSPWSTSYWAYGAGAIEAMLDSVRPLPRPASRLSFEGQLRARNKDRWTSSVDAGASMEELLDQGRDPLPGYRTTESLIDGAREKPLMLPVKKAWSYEPGIEAVGWMSNLDLPMSDRVQPFDENDEETTWFSSKFIRKQPRYNPEYGNPMSKEDEIYTWIVEPRFGVDTWEDHMNERPSLRTSPWQRAASDEGIGMRSFEALLDAAMRGVTGGSIRGTRIVMPQACVPMTRKFFENDGDVRLDVFRRPDGLVATWVVSHTIPEDRVRVAEGYLTGDDDSDGAREVFDYITGIPTVRADAISRMVHAVGDAARQAGGRTLVVGDLPLAVKVGKPWDRVRTVDFCSDDPDLCVKVAEIACERAGAECVGRDAHGMMVARWRGVTFRFACEATLEEELASRLLTPLMLAMDATSEEIMDPTGEATPDVEAAVVRAAGDPAEAVSFNPLSIVDAVFLASEFGFSIDSSFAEAAAAAEATDVDARSVWATIRAAGKGKSVSAAEEYGMGEALARLMGAEAPEKSSMEVPNASAD